MNRPAYQAYISRTNLAGSGKASSYVRALDLLCEMLRVHSVGFADCQKIWTVESVDRLQELHLRVIEEQKKGSASIWNLPNIPPSYLQKGYCAAALRSYQVFLIEHGHAQRLLGIFATFNDDESELPKHLSRKPDFPRFLFDDLDSLQGKDVRREVSQRVNQHVFRQMVLQNYSNTCCITGLDVPEVNRASHIVGWAKDESLRLDPRNGLCLSGTYDAAFDRHLLTLDDEYRIVLSRDLKDHYTSQAATDYFLRKEGERITLPKAYLPKKEYLESHRKLGSF